ncbi:hypothetical protein MAR_017994 [Mya arenaria]|uniref:Phage protein n=1 Tax=Mya arenaria TaxID=6604 RepID=A0ABY7ELF5_MYAAR|nr:hypothetical protein MAR_017994 [Mya arenaria]
MTKRIKAHIHVMLENDELIIERYEVVVAIKDSVDYLRTLPVHSNRETLELQSRIDDLEVKN